MKYVLILALVLVGCDSASVPTSPHQSDLTPDYRRNPPLERAYLYADGTFRLVISASGHWQATSPPYHVSLGGADGLLGWGDYPPTAAIVLHAEDEEWQFHAKWRGEYYLAHLYDKQARAEVWVGRLYPVKP